MHMRNKYKKMQFTSSTWWNNGVREEKESVSYKFGSFCLFIPPPSES